MSQVSLSGSNNIDALLNTYKWGSVNAAVVNITYSFPDQNSIWDNSIYDQQYREPEGLTPLNAEQQSYVRQALATWAAVANITFTEVPDNENSAGTIRIAFSPVVEIPDKDGTVAAAWAYGPDDANPLALEGDIWLSEKTIFSADTLNYDRETVIHELGHALGLKHPFYKDGENKITLPTDQDNTQLTIMSYTEYENVGDEYASSPMLYDIAAIQYLYGKNMNNEIGDNVYEFSTSTAELKTIWDAGGEDTFDLSNQTVSETINLNPGSFSSIGVYQDSQDNVLKSAKNNIGIAYGVTIEKVISGSGHDIITGNSADNTLSGGSGNDQIYGGEGDDFLDFELSARGGRDTLYGGTGNDDYVIDSLLDVIKELPNQGTDMIWSTMTYSLSAIANVENLSLFGMGKINATGNSLSNYLLGNKNDNTLNGLTGNDWLQGDAGKDKLIGSDGNDTLNGGLGSDTLSGGYGLDIFQLLDIPNSLNIDTISDFSAINDTIDLAKSVFQSFANYGQISSNYFRSGWGLKNAMDGDDYLVYNTANGALYYDAGGNNLGSASAIQIATLTNHPSLTYQDFLII